MPVLFRPIPGPHPDEPAFVVAVPGSVMRPDDFPSAGDLYQDVTAALQSRASEGWGAWKFGYWEQIESTRAPYGEDNNLGFFFFKNLPSTPVVVESTDVEIFGKVNQHRYLAETGDVLPVRGDVWTVPGGGTIAWEDGEEMAWEDGQVIAWEDGEYVYDAREESTTNGVTTVTVQTLPFNSVSRTDYVYDEPSGKVVPRTRTWTLSATRPDDAADLDPVTGAYTTVEGIGFNLWLTSRILASGLPTTRESAITWNTTGAVFWPAVLQNWSFKHVVNDAVTHWVKMLSYDLRDPYAQDVLVTKRLWFSFTAPTVDEPEEMIASGIKVDGQVKNFSIEPCLHAEFVYEESNLVQTGENVWSVEMPAVVVFTFPATALTDWPAFVTKTKVERVNGGFLVEESQYHRPTNYSVSTHEVTVREYDYTTDGRTHFYSAHDYPGNEFEWADAEFSI